MRFLAWSASQSHQAGIETSKLNVDSLNLSSTPNRTKLELKQCQIDQKQIQAASPNRTKLELKHGGAPTYDHIVAPPNRTKLELKRVRTRLYHQFKEGSQSHQAGIET